MLDFYITNGFHMFPCGANKAPSIPKGVDWRDKSVRFCKEKAENRMSKGQFVGVWIPEDYIVIDIDMNHKDKQGNVKPEGLKPFKLKCAELGITRDLLKITRVVQTGSGGYHLYFKKPKEAAITQGEWVTSVDIKTHSGYVIGAGSFGYSVINEAEPIDLPEVIKEDLQVEKKASSIKPKNSLSVETLRKILKKIDYRNFDTNDKWIDFVMSIIATCGNSVEILDAVEEWSRQDLRYSGDRSIRARLESFVPEGAITAGSFIFILKKENLSDHMILKVRREIGAFFQSSTLKMTDYHSLPDYVNFTNGFEKLDLIKQIFYKRDQANTVTVIAEMLKDSFIYIKGEKLWYYFDGVRWIEYPDILGLVYIILLHISEEFYVSYTKEDTDPDTSYEALLHNISSVKWRRDIVSELKENIHIFRKSIKWDENSETLTLRDGVLDFRGENIFIRKGKKDEYRRKYIDISVDDYKSSKNCETWDYFLETVFPNRETWVTANQALGLIVSGLASYRKFQVWVGSGTNGKSTLVNFIKIILGTDNAVTFDPENSILKGKDSGGLTPEIATFQGALCLLGSETEEGKRLSTAKIKNLASDDTIKANPKHKDPIEFKPTFQMIIATNDMPFFDANDKAFLNRLLILPFKSFFYKNEEEKIAQINKDHMFPAKDVNKMYSAIKAERPAIIKKLISIYLYFREENQGVIIESVECKNRKAVYVDMNDEFNDFIMEACEIDMDKDYFTSSHDLLDCFIAVSGNKRATSKYVVSKLLKARKELSKGSKTISGKLKRGLHGIKIKDDIRAEIFNFGFSSQYEEVH